MYIGKVTRSLAWWEGEGVDIKISDLSSKSQPHAWSKYSLQLGRRGKLGPWLWVCPWVNNVILIGTKRQKPHACIIYIHTSKRSCMLTEKFKNFPTNAEAREESRSN